MSIDLINNIINNGRGERRGFWHGNPVDETKEIYYKHFGIQESEKEVSEEAKKATQVFTTKTGDADLQLAKELKSDLVWISPELDLSSYQSPDGKPMWDFYNGKERTHLTEPGVFAECEDVKEVEAFDWPNPDYMDFANFEAEVDAAIKADKAVIGGMWMPFFHTVSDFFGMDNYFIKMYTDPDVVHAVTEKVVDFYIEANKRCLSLVKGKMSAGFFGNDFGSQRDLLISPECFESFISPYYRNIISTIKQQNLPVLTHSCGAISRIIPSLLDCGIDGLHPLQANAVGMDAESLAREYKDDLVFFGGVDTQHLLPFESPEKVKSEVLRLKQVFGERYIVSPSHEALLPNVSIENVLAMVDAVYTD
jgi:uroporphyrinogen decarboxylase